MRPGHTCVDSLIDHSTGKVSRQRLQIIYLNRNFDVLSTKKAINFNSDWSELLFNLPLGKSLETK